MRTEERIGERSGGGKKKKKSEKEKEKKKKVRERRDRKLCRKKVGVVIQS